MVRTFSGNCPVCSEQLLLDDESPNTAFCHCPRDHYSCKAEDFTRLWDAFDSQVERLGLHKASTAYAETLLENLRALNTVDIKHGTKG